MFGHSLGTVPAIRFGQFRFPRLVAIWSPHNAERRIDDYLALRMRKLQHAKLVPAIKLNSDNDLYYSLVGWQVEIGKCRMISCASSGVSSL
jgi:hypothetical protein